MAGTALFMRFMRMMRITSMGCTTSCRKSPGRSYSTRVGRARRLDPRRIPGALFVDTTTPALQPEEVPVVVERDVVIYCT